MMSGPKTHQFALFDLVSSFFQDLEHSRCEACFSHKSFTLVTMALLRCSGFCLLESPTVFSTMDRTGSSHITRFEMPASTVQRNMSRVDVA